MCFSVFVHKNNGLFLCVKLISPHKESFLRIIPSALTFLKQPSLFWLPILYLQNTCIFFFCCSSKAAGLSCCLLLYLAHLPSRFSLIFAFHSNYLFLPAFAGSAIYMLLFQEEWIRGKNGKRRWLRVIRTSLSAGLWENRGEEANYWMRSTHLLLMIYMLTFSPNVTSRLYFGYTWQVDSVHQRPLMDIISGWKREHSAMVHAQFFVIGSGISRLQND